MYTLFIPHLTKSPHFCVQSEISPHGRIFLHMHRLSCLWQIWGMSIWFWILSHYSVSFTLLKLNNWRSCNLLDGTNPIVAPEALNFTLQLSCCNPTSSWYNIKKTSKKQKKKHKKQTNKQTKLYTAIELLQSNLLLIQH